MRSLLLRGTQALWIDGDRPAGRDWLDAAYRMASDHADGEGMARSALGLSGLWLHEHRTTAAAARDEARLRRALAVVAPGSTAALRLAARLVGEADYRAGEHARILAAVRRAGQAGDAVALAEAASMAHQCLLGPEHDRLRRALCRDLIAAGRRSGRRGDLMTGLLFHVADAFLAGDPRAGRLLADLTARLTRAPHSAVGFVAKAIEVMVSVRAGRLDEAGRLADDGVALGRSVGDADAPGWHLLQTLAVRWYQGRAGQLLPMLTDAVHAPWLSAVDDSPFAALALVAAVAGDERRAASALARLRADLPGLPRSGTWLVTLHCAVEAANLLHDQETAAVAYDLLEPYADRPVTGGPAVVCFGSVRHALGVASLTVGDPARAATHLRDAVRHNLALGHRPAAVLSRARLAQALGPRAGRADAAEARHTAADLGMILPGYERPAGAGGTGRAPAITCRRRAGRWVVESGDRSAVVDDCVGMAYLAVLIANPGREIPAVRLAAGPGLPGVATGGTGRQPILDETAIRAYRQRMAELAGARTAIARAELDWIAAELKAASGLAGRARNFAAGDELARVSVGKAIRRALNRVAAADPVIGQRLLGTVATGLRCCYRPDPAC